MKTGKSKPIEVVAGLIVSNERVLVCQRSAEARFPLKWEFPGGKVEPGEAPAEALRRELREELAIEVIEAKELERYVHRYSAMPPVQLRFYRVIHYRGEVKNQVFQQIVWAESSKLGQFDFLEGDLRFIKRLAETDPAGLPL